MNGRVGKAMGAVALAAATTLLLPMAAQGGTVGECRSQIGFRTNDQKITETYIGIDGKTYLTVWRTIDVNGGLDSPDGSYRTAFRSKNTVSSCAVKVVQSKDKRPPQSVTMTLNEAMTTDECSLYNYLSAIDSKLDQNKLAEARTVAADMVNKLNTLSSTGKLESTGRGDILGATLVLQQCMN